MGTGSHRPQWETAKGRPDVTGGIRHARALKSHSQLKFRDPVQLARPIKQIEGPAGGGGSSSSSGSSDATTATGNGIDHTGDDDPDSDSDSDNDSSDDTDALRLELELLSKKQQLKEQLKSQKKRPAWKRDAAFRRKPRKSSNNAIDEIVK